MSTKDRRTIAKEERARRKNLLRAFREAELAKAWDKIADEVGPCDEKDLDRDCYTFDFLDRVPPSELEDLDEDYPNKIETMHNIYECD
jgi:hypothetical protein